MGSEESPEPPKSKMVVDHVDHEWERISNRIYCKDCGPGFGLFSLAPNSKAEIPEGEARIAIAKALDGAGDFLRRGAIQ